MEINSFWTKLKDYEGEQFKTVSDLSFTYEFKGENAIKVSRANQLLSKANFETAIKSMPLSGPGQISKIVRGSAYVYALLVDERLQ